MVRGSNSKSQGLQKRPSNRWNTGRNFIGRLVFLLFVFTTSTFAQTIDRSIAVVNDQVILQSDLEDFRKNLKNDGLVDDLLLSLVDSKTLQTNDKALLQFLVDQNVIDQEAKRKDVAVTIERVEQEIRQITQGRGITRAQLKTALATKGISFAKYQDFLKQTLERHSLIRQEVFSRIVISDEDIAAEFAKKTGRSQVYEYKIAHIFLASKNGGKAEAQARADRVKSQLEKGQSFDRLAKQFSEDPDFAEGGLLGTFKANELNASFEAAVRNLNVGDHSSQVQAKDGIHIFKLLEKRLVEDPAMARQKQQIQAELMNAVAKRQLQNWLNQKRQDYFIRVNI